MTSGAWLIFLAVATVMAAMSWIILWLLPRHERWLSIALPIGFFVILWPVSIEVLKYFVTCDDPDCGPLEFVAILMVASLISAAAFVGSIVGVILRLRFKR
jgi:hypothetical protein